MAFNLGKNQLCPVNNITFKFLGVWLYIFLFFIVFNFDMLRFQLFSSFVEELQFLIHAASLLLCLLSNRICIFLPNLNTLSPCSLLCMLVCLQRLCYPADGRLFRGRQSGGMLLLMIVGWELELSKLSSCSLHGRIEKNTPASIFSLQNQSRLLPSNICLKKPRWNIQLHITNWPAVITPRNLSTIGT
ncbi:hypothetical protein CFOL_v3_12134 [Cephalotus follicularis]|uniref:Uncharacterized protein n=1 Tax=Cephalotus follicularis TaxID=3775 RepID=A0A1Q3BKU8_CEPFO|nr:hypothetical protein CFOL_v3_12134 [Cephalotus follicularis]